MVRKPAQKKATRVAKDSAPPGLARLTITHITRSAWWCPRCDNSQPLDVLTCGKCGAKRTGPAIINTSQHHLG